MDGRKSTTRWPCGVLLLALLFPPVVGSTEPGYASALRKAVAFKDAPAERWSLGERMARWKVPGVSVAIIDDCRLVHERGFGVTKTEGAAVDSDTLFQAASISKPVTAFAALRLVQQDRLSLDADVDAQLESWKVPRSPLLEGHPVTLRGLLSHSAGLVPGGYGGYPRSEPVPTLLQTLDGKPPARPKPVQIAYAPSTDWRYSGGGYLVAQLLMSETTGQSFDRIIRDQVLAPIGMGHSGFEEPSHDSAGVAAGHTADGEMVPGGWHVYPELAAAGLWSTAPDLARFGLAAMKAIRSEPDALLDPSLAKQMSRAHLGPRSLGFVVDDDGRAHRFGHDGTNEGYNASLILFPETCQGAAIMANSDNAKPLIAELFRSLADTYRWPDEMPSVLVQRAAPNPLLAKRFVGSYQFTDIPGIAPFAITSSADGTFIFNRGDGHREPLVAYSEGLIGPDSGIIIKAVSPSRSPAMKVSYTRLGGRGAAMAERVSTSRLP